MNIENIVSFEGLNWRQKLYLRILSRIPNKIYNFIQPRGNSKPCLSFINLCEELKKKAKTKEEKELYEIMQKEMAKFHIGLALGYWKGL